MSINRVIPVRVERNHGDSQIVSGYKFRQDRSSFSKVSQ
jgi:hypothetical protein